MKGMIFQNSKGYINEGRDHGKGLLYCGSNYTGNGGCPCGTCDGYCGTTNGCPCPDCEYTLSYLLFASGKMTCRTCYKSLIRIKIFELKALNKTNPNASYRCDNCYKYMTLNYIPLMHCIKCNYNICPDCALKKAISFENNKPKLEIGIDNAAGMIYCKNNFTTSGFCLCKGCDGNCGPENGCPCPLCESILCYNLYLKHQNLYCFKCKNMYVKTTVLLLKKLNPKVSMKCKLCSKKAKDEFEFIFYCRQCLEVVCNICAFRNNIGNITNIKYPNLPLNLETIEKEIREKIQKEKNGEMKICFQRKFRITNKKETGNIICIYLKTLIGRIYTIKIDDGHDVINIKEELRKLDKKYNLDNTILIFKNKKLSDDTCINDCGITNESLINIILK